MTLAEMLDQLERARIGHAEATRWLGVDSYTDLVRIVHANGRQMPGHQPTPTRMFAGVGRLTVGFRPAIPRRVAPQQSPLPLRRRANLRPRPPSAHRPCRPNCSHFFVSPQGCTPELIPKPVGNPPGPNCRGSTRLHIDVQAVAAAYYQDLTLQTGAAKLHLSGAARRAGSEWTGARRGTSATSRKVAKSAGARVVRHVGGTGASTGVADGAWHRGAYPACRPRDACHSDRGGFRNRSLPGLAGRVLLPRPVEGA
jgi:hypothetical protein